MSKALFTTVATSNNTPKGGYVKTEDGLIDLTLVNPLMKSDKTGSNPEQLFAAGYASCFDGALNFVAMKKKLKIESKTTAEIGFHNDSADKGYKMSAVLHVQLKDVSEEEAEVLVEAAHQFCPFSKAINGNMDVEVNFEVI